MRLPQSAQVSLLCADATPSSAARASADPLGARHARRAAPADRAARSTPCCPPGFDLLDDVLAGGIRQGEVLLLGGKPGVGKTIASLQWARSMAQRGIVAVYLCYEHDEVTLVTRLLVVRARRDRSPPRRPVRAGVGHDELQARIRDVAAGAITLREALDSDPLLAASPPPPRRLRRPPRPRHRVGGAHRRQRDPRRDAGVRGPAGRPVRRLRAEGPGLPDRSLARANGSGA